MSNIIENSNMEEKDPSLSLRISLSLGSFSQVPKDKSVIIIGNGPSCLDKEQGDKIDDFDIVVRINNYKLEGYKKQLGTKTTYWAVSDYKINFDKEKYDKIDGVLYWDITRRKSRYGWDGKEKIIRVPGKYTIRRMMGYGFNNYPKKPWPSTGCGIVGFFIQQGFTDISILGFDSSFQNNYQHYYDNEEEKKYYSRITHCHSEKLESRFFQLNVESERIKRLG